MVSVAERGSSKLSLCGLDVKRASGLINFFEAGFFESSCMGPREIRLGVVAGLLLVVHNLTCVSMADAAIWHRRWSPLEGSCAARKARVRGLRARTDGTNQDEGEGGDTHNRTPRKR